MTAHGTLDEILASLSAARHPSETNPFRILRIQDDELRQSAWIAALLQPDASHGRGPELLQGLIDATGSHFDSGRDYAVRTEFARFHSQIDIAAARFGPGGFLVYLENKVWSGFGTKQVESEREDMLLTAADLRIPSQCCRLVVLLPEGAILSPPDGTAVMTYRQLGELVEPQSKLMSSVWRLWVEAWLEALPARTRPPDRSVRSDVSRQGDRQIFELLQRFARRVAEALDDLPVEAMRLPGHGQAPSGQVDLKLRWRSGAMQDVQLGVEWLWPEYLVSDRLGEQPRFWVWHKRGRSREAGLVAAALKRFDSHNSLEPERDERRFGYLYQAALPSYVSGELGFAEQLEDRLVTLFSTWARRLDAVDQELAGAD